MSRSTSPTRNASTCSDFATGGGNGGGGGGGSGGSIDQPGSTVTTPQQEIEPLKKKVAALTNDNAVLTNDNAVFLTNETNDLKCRFQQLEDDLANEKERSGLYKQISSYDVNWYDLPDKWKNDPGVACEFFKRKWKPQTTPKKQLPNDPQGRKRPVFLRPYFSSLPYQLRMNKDVVLHALMACNEEEELVSWDDDVHESMKNDIDLIRTAVLYGHKEMTDFDQRIWKSDETLCAFAIADGLIEADDSFSDDRKCITEKTWKKHIEERTFDWTQLPLLLRKSQDFATSIDWNKLVRSSRFGDDSDDWRPVCTELRMRLDSTSTWNGWKELITLDGFQWHYLPSALRESMDFAKSINLSGIENATRFLEVVSMIFQNVPSLRSDRGYWKYIHSVCSNDDGSMKKLYFWYFFGHLLKKYASEVLLSDKKFMFPLAKHYMCAFKAASAILKTDQTFIDDVFSKNVLVLGYVGREMKDDDYNLILGSLPDLNKDYLRRFGRDDLEDFASAIPSGWWQNEEFTNAWCQAGLLFAAPSDVKSILETNRQLCLLNAKHAKYIYTLNFARDASFMLELVRHRPDAYTEAIDEVAMDPRVMTAVFAVSMDLTKKTLTQLHFNGDDDKICILKDYLENELRPYQIFCTCVFPNLLPSKRYESTHTRLTLLGPEHLGEETSLVYRRDLAEYAGVPTGKRLIELKTAYNNVKEVVQTFTKTTWSPWEITCVY